MTPARRGHPLAIALLVCAAGGLAAQDTKPVGDAKAFDKLVVDTLRDIHNKGADLYNTSRDFSATYRLYQGSLVTVRPLLGHRPEAQKLIDAGIATSEKESDVARKAFALHEAIEKVRAYLKTAPAIEPPPVVKPKTDGTKKPADKATPKVDDTKKPKVDDTKKTTPPKKTDDSKKPDDTQKPDEPIAVRAKPEATNPGAVNPKGPAETAVKGAVTIKGKPLPDGNVTLVSLKLPAPRVFTALTATDGSYQIKEAVTAGEYAVIVSGKGVPEKYTTTTTSAIRVEVKTGANQLNFDLQ